MKPIKLTALTISLLISAAILAQNKNDDSQKPERNFRNFRLDFAGSGIRFIGKKETGVNHSKTGYGGHIQPAWNITDNHSLGLKMVWSYHDEKNGTSHFSLLVNYMYTYYGGPNEIPTSMEKLVAVFGGIGAGLSNGPAHNSDSTFKNNRNKTSFAAMPYVGIRYGVFFADGHFHWAAGNKQNTYFGFSAGLIFGGGLIHDLSRKSKQKS